MVIVIATIVCAVLAIGALIWLVVPARDEVPPGPPDPGDVDPDDPDIGTG